MRERAQRGLEFDIALTRGGFSLEAAFDAAPGEIVALVGPSAAGKTTCLELIAGLATPSRGRIALGGETLFDAEAGVDLEPRRRRAGLVFQDYALLPHLTVRENVAYGPRARGRPRVTARAEAGRWIERLRLTPVADRRPHSLSGGQRQRAALARALASDARVLLLDEPFAALDAATRDAARGELRAFLAEVALPTVLVTHDALDALALGDRIVALEQGRVTQAGTPDQLLRHPRTPFVARLTGLNLLRARLGPGQGLREARAGSLLFHVLDDGPPGEAFLSFTPAEIALGAGPFAGSAQNQFRAKVSELLPLPDRTRVVLDAGDRLAADVTRESVASLGLAAGRVVWAAVKATAIRVYR